MLRLETFGRVSLSGPGVPELSQQRRRLALLVLLSDSGERGMTRDRLLALLWPERPTDAARRALDQTLYMLRRSLGAELLVGVDPLRLNPTVCTSDLAEFEEAMSSDKLAAAAAIYRGPFMDGFHVNGAAEFERWTETARSRQALRYRECLERLARETHAAGDREGSVGWWRRLAAEDPLSSRVALELVRTLAESGDLSAAVDHARLHETLVRQELDAEPDPRIMAYVARLREPGSRASGPAVPAQRATGAEEVAYIGIDPPRSADTTLGQPEPALRTSRRTRWRSRSVLLSLTATAALAASGYTALQVLKPQFPMSSIGRGGANGSISLLVTDFSVTGIDSMTGMAIGIALRTALSESPVFALHPVDSIADALQRMRRPANARLDLPLAREVARREGIRAIMDGHVVAIGTGYDVGLRLLSAESGDALFASHRLLPHADSILPAFDDLSRALRRRIGESGRSIRASQPLPRVTTASLPALRLFAGAMAAGNTESAVDLLREAIRADSQFAMAYRRLFVVAGTLGLGDRDSAIWHAYRHRDHLTERERLAVTAMFYSLPGYGGDRPKAINAYERLIALGDSSQLVNLASVYRFRRDYARSESLAVLAARVCKCAYPWDDILSVQIDAGLLDRAEHTLRAARASFPSNPALAHWPLYMRYHRGDLDAYEHGADSMRAMSDPGARRRWTRIRRNVALTRGRLAEAGRLDEELAVLSGVADGSRSRDPLQQVLLHLEITRDTARAARVLEAVTGAAPSWRGSPRRLLDIAPWFARTGQPQRARAFLSRYERLADTATRRKAIHDYHVALAWVALAERRYDDAIAEFRLGDQLPDGPRNPMWYQLHGRLGRVYDAAGRADSAIAHYERWAGALGSFRPQNADLELAAVLERLGDLHARANREKAVEYYSRFIELWKAADPELQPRVDAARMAVASMGLDTRRVNALPRAAPIP